MREFFKGWRRKVGCIVLAMACVLAGAFARSLTRLDQIYFNGAKSNLVIASGDQKLILMIGGRFNSVYHDISGTRNRIWQLTWSDEELLPSRDPINWYQHPAFRVDFVSNVDGDKMATISYLSIVLPLTLLSAILILWPRRKPKA